MEWLSSIVTGLALLVMFFPLIALMLTFFVLVPMAHLMSPPAMVARTSLDCPFSHRKVDVAFLTSPDSPTPSDVLRCSLFGEARVTCKKECADMMESGWTPSPMTPRYSLLSDGAAFRG